MARQFGITNILLRISFRYPQKYPGSEFGYLAEIGVFWSNIVMSKEFYMKNPKKQIVLLSNINVCNYEQRGYPVTSIVKKMFRQKKC